MTNVLYKHFHSKNLRDQILPCHKIGHEQPRVIIYIYFKELSPKLLHTTFQGNRSSGSGEEFLNVFMMFGQGGHLGQVNWTKSLNVICPLAWRLHIKYKWNCPALLEENAFKYVDDRSRGYRPISSSGAFGREDIKIWNTLQHSLPFNFSL